MSIKLRVCDFRFSNSTVNFQFRTQNCFPSWWSFVSQLKRRNLMEKEYFFFRQFTSPWGKFLPNGYCSQRTWQTLLGKTVPIDCFSQTVCRLDKASFFHLSAYLRYTIVITRDKSLTWLSPCWFFSQVLQLKSSVNRHWFDWLYDNQIFFWIVFSRK